MPQFDLRKDYTLHSLDEQSADPDPFRQFACWYEDAEREVLGEANAVTLATASPAGAPSARVVLLKGFDASGFVFYTNYESRKSRELAANPQAALLFFWPELQRQVRIEGAATRVSREETQAYFATRPRASQLGAWASRQSEVLPDRQVLEERLRELAARYEGREVELPPHWGGYRLVPGAFEFWQGRPSRLHDRLRYRPDPAAGWQIVRLSP